MKLKDARKKAKDSPYTALMVRNHQRKMFPKLLEALDRLMREEHEVNPMLGLTIEQQPRCSYAQAIRAIAEANEVEV